MRRIIGAALKEHGAELADYFKSNDYGSVGISKIMRPELFNILHVKYVFGCPNSLPPRYKPMDTPLSTQLSVDTVDLPFAVFESWVVVKEESVIDTMSRFSKDAAGS